MTGLSVADRATANVPARWVGRSAVVPRETIPMGGAFCCRTAGDHDVMSDPEPHREVLRRDPGPVPVR
jgi:hypothetical protein